MKQGLISNLNKIGSIEKPILFIILDYQISLYPKLCFFNLSGSVSFFSLGTWLR